MNLSTFSIQNLQKNSIEKIGFAFLLLLSMLLIIIPKYYITGDGASHIYNAKVFVDYLLSNDRQFYKPFYEINRNIDPNWTSQIILGIFTKIFPYWLAEKMFQIIYVAAFAHGFRKLIKSVSTNHTSISLLFYPFCFTLPFQMGFYNYSLAYPILFYVLAYFIKNRNLFFGLQQIIFTLGILILSLTHGMVASHCILLCSFIILLDAIDEYKQKKTFLAIINDAAPKLVSMLIGIFILIAFAMRQGLLTSPHPLSVSEKLSNFVRLYCCQSTMHIENIPAIGLGIGIVIISIIFFTQGKCNDNKIRNVYLIFAIYTLLGYLSAPNTIGYAGGTDIRLAFLPPLFVLLAASTYSVSKKIENTVAIFAIIITISFISIRFNNVISASNETKKLLLIAKKIETKKTILTIQYNTHGSKNQFEIDNSFLHIFDYIGAMQNKKLILLNNYEADLNYFSLHWRAGMNPRNYMPNIINGLPPLPSEMVQYELATNNKIDFIIWQDDVRKGVKKMETENLKLFIVQRYNCIDSVAELGVQLFARKN
jgi:hypothetical protein